MSSRFPLYIIGIVLFASFFSCTDMVPTKEVRLIDSLNGKAYAYRYRSLDSSYKYANEAYRQVNFISRGKRRHPIISDSVLLWRWILTGRKRCIRKYIN